MKTSSPYVAGDAKARVTRGALTGASLLALGVVAFACKDPVATTGADAGPHASGSASAATTTAAPNDSPGSDEIRPVYPRDAGASQPLAVRLCDALYSLPSQRASACCASPPSGPGPLANECARILSYAIESKAVKLEAASVDACVQSMTQATNGCDWVTPSPSVPLPPVCDGIVQGQLEDKATCRSSLECKDGQRCIGLSAVDLGIAVLHSRPAPRATSRTTRSRCSRGRMDMPEITPSATDTAARADVSRRSRKGRRASPTPHAASFVARRASARRLRCLRRARRARARAPLDFAARAAAAKHPRQKATRAATTPTVVGRCVMGDGGAGGTCAKMCEQAWSYPPLKPVNAAAQPGVRPPAKLPRR